ncbi:unnamed protein product [Rotaria magnacalcarata]|uniref:G-protein coupled receptors family 1 profile domain-containing protein n=2 Tax=Rotaria magnacalcarata TaxID=392030 RepID=A0A816M0M7_9BILA|nr:unnamed protein product [Rotaria magnacalcarata]
MAIYMLIWDQQSLPTIDYLCKFRGYLHHSTIAYVHHSFILQAIEKYVKIKRMKLLDTPTRKFSIVLAQWMFDFSFSLPVFITGNIVKMKIDNLCFVSFDRLDLVFTMSALTFVVSDMVLAVLYRRLVMYVRQTSSRVNGSQRLRIQRDLTMVRRIVVLHAQLVLVGSPALVVIILNAVRSDILPYGSMRMVFIIMNLALTFLTTVLFRNTPHLRQAVVKCFHLKSGLLISSTNRVRPMLETNRF